LLSEEEKLLLEKALALRYAGAELGARLFAPGDAVLDAGLNLAFVAGDLGHVESESGKIHGEGKNERGKGHGAPNGGVKLVPFVTEDGQTLQAKNDAKRQLLALSSLKRVLAAAQGKKARLMRERVGCLPGSRVTLISWHNKRRHFP
jgi:hypothetical protein